MLEGGVRRLRQRIFATLAEKPNLITTHTFTHTGTERGDPGLEPEGGATDGGTGRTEMRTPRTASMRAPRASAAAVEHSFTPSPGPAARARAPGLRRLQAGGHALNRWLPSSLRMAHPGHIVN